MENQEILNEHLNEQVPPTELHHTDTVEQYPASTIEPAASADEAQAPLQESKEKEETIPSTEIEALNAKLDEISKISEMILGLVQTQNLEIEGIRKNQEETIKELDEKYNEKRDKLEHIIQTVQEDRYRKDKGKLINRSIFLADMVRKTILEAADTTKDMTPEQKEEFFITQLKNIVTGIESMLTDEGVKIVHFAAVGEKVNPEYQEVLDVKITEDEALDGAVAEILNPGYFWTMPYILKAKLNENGEEIKHYKFLMQTEQVIAYKFFKQQ